MSGFSITRRKGFHIAFDNGWTASVQFGSGNYCAARDLPALMRTAEETGATDGAASADAEIAAWDANDEWYRPDDWDDYVKGWQTPADVLAFLNAIAALPAASRPAADTGDDKT